MRQVAAALTALCFSLAAIPAHAKDDDAEPARVTAALGDGVKFRTDDDSFLLQVRARIQARFTMLTAEKDPDTGRPTGLASQEFQIRRQRLLFAGHIGSKKLQYYIQLGFSNRDTEPDLRLPLRDAYITYKFVRDLSIRFGQMKVPFNRQRVVSSSAMMFPDRSLANDELNLDRDVGLQLLSRDLFGLGGRLGYNIGLFGGDGRNRLSSRSGMLYIAKLEVRPFGDFEDYIESDWGRSTKPRLALAVTYAHNVNTVREGSTTDATRVLSGLDYRHAAADMMFKIAGFSLQSELLYRTARPGQSVAIDIEPSGAVTTEYARNAWGWFTQAGQLLTEHFEIAARVGEVRPIGVRASDFTMHREIGGGVSYYFQEHALKLQADYFYLTEQSETRPAMLARHQARLQFQLYF